MTESLPHSPSRPSIRGFLEQLISGAGVQVQAVGEPAPKFDDGAMAVVRDYYEAARLELAGTPPDLDLGAAGWAAEQFYAACQFLVSRDAPAERVEQVLGSRWPAARGAAVDFSVDLVFRFLSALYGRARGLAPADPLVKALLLWARDWPLSSVGIRLEDSPVLETFAGSSSLWRLYVDRIADRLAEDRWRDPGVAEQLRADLGAFPELAPALSESLRRGAAHLSSPSLST